MASLLLLVLCIYHRVDEAFSYFAAKGNSFLTVSQLVIGLGLLQLVFVSPLCVKGFDIPSLGSTFLQ